MFRTASFLLYSLIVLVLSSVAARAQELNTALMNGTFEIAGPSAKAEGKTTFGTVFFLGKPLKADPQKGSYVLITATHVLDEISGDTATLVLRKKDATGALSKFPYTISIRQNGTKLYVTNPDADVAAMFVHLPTDTEIKLLPIAFLADDARLEHLEVHPGDELLCLGFPLAADVNGFPVVRSGLLASYPITPSKTVKQYYYNFHTFPGNSGGPVYFNFLNRVYGNATHLGDVQQGIIGLVTQQVTSQLPEFKDAPLDIAIVVPSSYIQDTIAMLPEEPSN